MTGELFAHLPFAKAPARTFGKHGYPIWSKNKSLMIERYLRFFVLVTKHGAYIDGFAGPQRDNESDLWSARRVLANKPKWLRTFVLCDLSEKQVARLVELKKSQPPPDKEKREPKRTITIHHGDFNFIVGEALASAGIVGKKTAAFCLLDQRTFECHWATIGKVAAYRPEQKIELFYLLPINWLKRSLAATKDEQILVKWWGRGDWATLRPMAPAAIADLVASRFVKEFGYQSVNAYPVRQSQISKRTMYFMIHATDHPDAPKLMMRAYKQTDNRVFRDIETMDLEEFLTKHPI
jgi:three-Cys-motif partner protein